MESRRSSGAAYEGDGENEGEYVRVGGGWMGDRVLFLLLFLLSSPRD